MSASLPPTSYFVPGEVTSPKFARAFAQGCGGGLTNLLDRLQPGPFAGFCTPPLWPLLDRAIADQRDYYYGDHAFWGRGKYYRVAKNTVQFQPARADLHLARPHRLRQLAITPVAEWQRSGRSIVICPNSTVYMQRFGFDAQQWAESCRQQIAAVSDRPVLIRWKAQRHARPLAQDLDDAWIVVVFSSNAAVEALVAGVPIAVLAPWASTAGMGISDLSKIETPIYPSHRLSFLWSLAEQQWTLSEIATGAAWRTLCQRHSLPR